MTLNIVRADPAGNITLLVLDPVPPEGRGEAAARLMARPDLGAEQVGFLCPPRQGGAGRLEMMGGEFCGNATRAVGMLLSRRLGRPASLRVEVSGCHRPVTVEVDHAAGAARAEMPLPRWVRRVEAAGAPAVLVHLGGIAHLVTERAPSLDFFRQAEPLLQAVPRLDAYGVIFLDPGDESLTPLVKVPAAGTLVWEGSCGSGSLAAAVAQSLDRSDGTFSRRYRQPAGTIEAAVTRREGRVASAWIGGPVALDEPIQIQI